MPVSRFIRTSSLLLGLVACAAASRAAVRALPQNQQLRAESFTREINPFPVLDARGQPHEFPFLGGFDVPRPQFVDIDGDGDQDLFVQEYSRSLRYFENMGSAGSPRFVWRSDRYQELDIGEWFRFSDLDADGDFDLLAEEPFSYVRLFLNRGTAALPRFEHADSLRDGDGKALFVDRQNIPALVDLDCDGRLDLFVGRVEGIVFRYEAEERGVPRFTLQDDYYEGIEIIGQIDTTGTMRHGANALAFADFDGDGDYDLFWGDFFERAVLLIENVGRTCSIPSLAGDPYVLPYADSVRTSGYNVPVPVDLDSDGDMDFLMGVLGGAFNSLSTSADNFYHWERIKPDSFALRSKRFLNGIDVGSESAPALVDLDGDGDLDMVIGNKIDPASGDAARLFVYRNEGNRTSPSFRFADTLTLSGAYNNAPVFADMDSDGDPDLLLGTWNQGVQYYRNDGNPREPRFVLDSSVVISTTRMSNAMPALGDIDGDGDLDLFVGEATGEISFFRNDGTARAPRFTFVSERMDNIDVGRRSAPALIDVDRDGRLDLVIGREDQGLAVYRNAGTASQPRFEEYRGFTLPTPPMSTPGFVDIDGNGSLDFFAGTVSGGVVFFRSR